MSGIPPPRCYRASTAQSRGVISTLPNPSTLLSVSVKNRESIVSSLGRLYTYAFKKDYLLAPHASKLM